MTGQEAAARVASTLVKKVLAALAGILGIAWLRRRAAQPVGPDPAEALRAKLAEQREPEPQPGPDPGPEPEPEPEPEQQEDVAARRSEVHDRARQAMDDLSGPAAEE
jgi:hypothetical protein